MPLLEDGSRAHQLGWLQSFPETISQGKTQQVHEKRNRDGDVFAGCFAGTFSRSEGPCAFLQVPNTHMQWRVLCLDSLLVLREGAGLWLTTVSMKWEAG